MDPFTHQNRILKRALLSYGALVFLFILSGLIFLKDASKLSSLTQHLYDHSQIVSDTSLQMNVDLLNMHRALKDMVENGSTEDMDKRIQQMDDMERHIQHHQGRIQYASDQASEFLRQYKETKKRIIIRAWIFHIAGIFLSILICYFTVRRIAKILQNLHREKRHLETTLRSIGDGVIVTDHMGRVTMMNGIAEKMTGWSAADTYGMDIEDIFTIINAHTREPLQNPVSKVIDTGNIQGLTNHTLLVSKDKTEYQIDDSAAPIQADQGLFLGVILVFRDVTQDRKVLKELHESRAILQAAMDNSQAGIAIADAPSGKLRYVNQAGLMIRNPSQREFIKDIDIDNYVSSWRLFHLDGTPYKTDEVPMARALLYGESVKEELIIRREDEEDRYVVANASPVQDENDDVVAGVVVFLDITNRVKAENERRLNEARLEISDRILRMHGADEREIADFVRDRMLELLDSPMGFIGTITDDGTHMHVNSWSQSVMEQCEISDIPLSFPISDSGLWGEPIRQEKPVIINDYHASHPCKHGCPAGHAAIHRYMGVPVFDGERIVMLAAVSNKPAPYSETDAFQLSQLIHVMAELIQKKRKDMALVNSEARWRSMVKSSPDHIVLLDRDLKIEFASSASPGLSVEQLVGIDPVTHAEKDSQPQIRNILRTTLETGRPNSYETSYITPENSIIYYESRVVPRTVSGDIVGLTISARDITANKRAETQKALLEAKLRQAQKMEAIGTLSGGIAHDFNNILSIILGNAELAIEDIPHESPLKNFIHEIKTAAMRARDMVRQILNFSRQSHMEKEPVHISQLVTESLKLLRASLPATIGMEQTIPFISSVVMANPTQVHQVIMNLCINAAYAMDNEGTLTVSLEEHVWDKKEPGLPQGAKPGNHIRISVTDTGCGISQEIREKIFDPYFTTKETGKGSGMGLSVVYGIVKEHGGTITLESTPGTGSTFSVFFPTVEKKLIPMADASGPIPKGTEHILFVDDEEMIVRMAEKMLSSMGYTLDCCHYPEQALKKFRKSPASFDLVITDMNMPGMSGVKLASSLREIKEDIPILLSTGYSDKIDEARASELGIGKLLIKPVTRSMFGAAIRQLLDGRKE